MAVSEMRMHSAWDPRALEDVVQSSCTEAVVVTDKNGRVLYSELRRDTPEDLGALAELAFAQVARAGDKLGLSECFRVDRVEGIADNFRIVATRAAVTHGLDEQEAALKSA
jgi:hypothetical protein